MSTGKTNFPRSGMVHPELLLADRFIRHAVRLLPERCEKVGVLRVEDLDIEAGLVETIYPVIITRIESEIVQKYEI